VLADEGYVWPKKVRAAVDRVATYYFQASATYKTLSAAGSTWADAYFTDDEQEARDVAKVRLGLGLPPAGEGCDSYS